MRHSTAAIAGLVILGCNCFHAGAAETGSRWWPFGKNSDAEITQSPVVAPEVAPESTASTYPKTEHPPSTIESEPERRWMINSPLAKVSWPRVHMPEMPKPRMPKISPWPEKSAADTPPDTDAVSRNTWVEKTPHSLEPSPLQGISNGAKRVRQGTRNAWDKTVAAFTPGDGSSSAPNSSRITRGETRPPFWKRMIGSEKQQQEGPQTVTEWMAQERVDP